MSCQARRTDIKLLVDNKDDWSGNKTMDLVKVLNSLGIIQSCTSFSLKVCQHVCDSISSCVYVLEFIVKIAEMATRIFCYKKL